MKIAPSVFRSTFGENLQRALLRNSDGPFDTLYTGLRVVTSTPAPKPYQPTAAKKQDAATGYAEDDRKDTRDRARSSYETESKLQLGTRIDANA